MDYDYDLGPEGEEDYYPDFYPDNEVLDDKDLSPWSEQGGLPPMSVYKLLSTCIEPTLSDGIKHAGKALAWCIIFRITTQTINIPQQMAHMISMICGTVLMYHFFDTSLLYLWAQGLIAYVSLYLTAKVLKQKSGWICFAACIGFLLTCELVIVRATEWHMIRAVQMLVAMRAISVGFQIDDKSLPNVPEPLQYFGYLFHVGTVSFGPWVSFKDYINIPANSKRSPLLCVVKIAWSLLLSMFFLSVSTCWIHWLIPSGTSKWLLAYRDAFSFRSSHYFVSYLSEATAVAAGLDTSPTGQWAVTVTNPLAIEFPRSLVEVVINWNMPMHSWLKTYVFRVARPYGTFLAVLGTYGVSALLHGLNFQLAAVLLSLGFYTYTEHVFRQKLASVFSACIQARKCGSANCGHRYKEAHWAVKLTNILLGLLAMFHLAYLGLMFDSSKLQEEGYSFYHTLNKWRWLGYSSHWITLGTFVFYTLI